MQHTAYQSTERGWQHTSAAQTTAAAWRCVADYSGLLSTCDYVGGQKALARRHQLPGGGDTRHEITWRANVADQSAGVGPRHPQRCRCLPRWRSWGSCACSRAPGCCHSSPSTVSSASRSPSVRLMCSGCASGRSNGTIARERIIARRTPTRHDRNIQARSSCKVGSRLRRAVNSASPHLTARNQPPGMPYGTCAQAG